MAISAQAITLAQYANMSNDPLVKKISYSLYDNGSILSDLPLVINKSLIVNGVRWTGNLPTVNWQKINTDPTVTSGTPSPFQEQAYILRNSIDVDKFLVEDVNSIQDPQATQIDAYLKGVAYDINYKFIKNDHATGDTESFVGVRARLDDPATYGTKSENKINAGVEFGTANVLDLSSGGMTASIANNALEMVDKLLWACDSPDGTNVVLYMNDVMQRRFATMIRRAGLGAGWNAQVDAYGRDVMSFKNAQVKDIGRKADQTTRIILNTEDLNGVDSTSTMTSMYAVRYDTDHLFGWQFEPLVPQNIGLIGNGGATYRTVFNWAVGIFVPSQRSMARAFNIKIS